MNERPINFAYLESRVKMWSGYCNIILDVKDYDGNIVFLSRDLVSPEGEFKHLATLSGVAVASVWLDGYASALTRLSELKEKERRLYGTI